MNTNTNTKQNLTKNAAIDSNAVLTGENAARLYRIISEERLRRAQNEKNKNNEKNNHA